MLSINLYQTLSHKLSVKWDRWAGFVQFINLLLHCSSQFLDGRLFYYLFIYFWWSGGQVRSCFTYDTFFATDVRRMGDGGIVIGNMRRSLEEVKPKLEASLVKACGCEVDLWFLEETINETTKQVNTSFCM
jgi:hypothetical protein